MPQIIKATKKAFAFVIQCPKKMLIFIVIYFWKTDNNES